MLKDVDVCLSQVIMLSSITELHSYIDRTQLTQELGGTQEYCHEKWISHRTVCTVQYYPLIIRQLKKKHLFLHACKQGLKWVLVEGRTLVFNAAVRIRGGII